MFIFRVLCTPAPTPAGGNCTHGAVGDAGLEMTPGRAEPTPGDTTAVGGTMTPPSPCSGRWKSRGFKVSSMRRVLFEVNDSGGCSGNTEPITTGGGASSLFVSSSAACTGATGGSGRDTADGGGAAGMRGYAGGALAFTGGGGATLGGMMTMRSNSDAFGSSTSRS